MSIAKALTQFYDDAQRTTSIREIEAALEEVLPYFGAKYFLANHIPPRFDRSSSASNIYVGYSDALVEWYYAYTSSALYRRDPVWSEVQRMEEAGNLQPLRWSRDIDLTLVAQQGKDVMAMAASLGMRDGITVPYQDDMKHGRLALMSFVLVDNFETDFDEVLTIQSMRFLTAAFFGRVERLLAPRKSQIRAALSLSDNQRETLEWFAAGKTAWEIAQILDISESAVRGRRREILKKLDAVNITQAVAFATAERIIDPPSTTFRQTHVPHLSVAQ